jgi:regulator of RNase E activity RraB
MFKLITFKGDIKHELEFDTYEESLSAAMDAFNQGYELHEIQKDGEIILFHVDIYQAIGKAVY